MSRPARHITQTITNGIIANDKIVTYERTYKYDQDYNEITNGRHGIGVQFAFKHIRISAEQYAKLLAYQPATAKPDDEGLYTGVNPCNYLKFAVCEDDLYGYDVTAYEVTTPPTESEAGYCRLKVQHRMSFGNQAQKRLFSRLDNLANVFESVYSKKQNQVFRYYSTQSKKHFYRQPTFLTLTVPLQGKFFKRIQIAGKLLAEALERAKKNLQEFHRWLRWRFMPDMPEDNDIISANIQPAQKTTAKKQRHCEGGSATEAISSAHEVVIRYGISDNFIKKNLLNRLLQNLSDTYGAKAYVWKAEAQTRGDIHFHIILDCYIARNDIRRLWWGYIRKYGLYKNNFEQGDLFKLHTLENINLWIQGAPNPQSLKYEMAGYFAHRLDKHGNVVYKHNPRKRVRSIEGSAWGSSDNLKYDQLTITDLGTDTMEMLEENCVRYIEVNMRDKDDKTKFKLGYDGKPMVQARVYVTRQSTRTKERDATGPAEYTTREKHYQPVREQLYDYHFKEALKIYANENTN